MRARTPALAASGAVRSLPSRPPARRPAGAGGPDPCGGSRRGSGGEDIPPRLPGRPEGWDSPGRPRVPLTPRRARWGPRATAAELGVV